MQNNVDPILHTYKFWKEVESLSKKQKEDTLKEILHDFPLRDPKDYINGELYVLEYKLSERKTFDFELFKTRVKERYPQVNVKVLDSIHDESKSPSPFRTYKVKEKL